MAIMGAIYVAGSRASEPKIHYSLASVARDLNVDPRLLRAVMRPSYADLDFRQGLQGMSYEKYFSKTKAPMLLVHSSDSHIVTSQVLESTKAHKDIHLFSVPGSAHPVSYTNSVNDQIEDFICQDNQSDRNENDDPEGDISDWFERFKGKKFL